MIGGPPALLQANDDDYRSAEQWDWHHEAVDVVDEDAGWLILKLEII